ncbi:MAG: PEP-CTERM sorting domain-containing protein [Planctomycetaceae bacterium]|nr:PEP-CTERM sorting domain-containing protein [Planctomycetaceae bacterium]
MIFALLVSGSVSGGETIINASRVASDLSRPIFATAPTDDFGRLFIAEQHTGEVRILDLATGELLPEPFLDIGRPSRGNEQGLLGLAFDPDYANNGQLFVNYTDSRGTTRIERYQVSENPNLVDQDSATPILQYSQPQSNHNGGWIGFGPDNYLYISSGDGGAANDTGSGHTSSVGNGQDITNNLLGKMLRLDISSDAYPNDTDRNYAIPGTNPFRGQAGDDEIWAYGLRNPWRSGFDRATGDLYIADVGQNIKEEINFQPANSAGGENYGWRLREGTITTPGGVGGPAPMGAVDPIHEYNHVNSTEGGFSVTGGYVYRGPIEDLQGHYFFADFVSNQIWSLKHENQTVSSFQNRTDQIRTDKGLIESISSFAEDAAGNLYVVSLNGDVYRFDGMSEQVAIVDRGSVWKYLDDGSDQASAWRTAEFDDDQWAEGPAELGYGDDPATEVSYGGIAGQKHPTTYFRHDFEVADPTLYESLELDLFRDDGAAVYINGIEVLRNNLDADAKFDSLATRSVGGTQETQPISQTLPVDSLLVGMNTLAVEVHQFSLTSSDLRFDLQLNGILGDPSLPGDFNGDALVDVRDIDDLNSVIRGGDFDPKYDLNQDGILNEIDRDVWVRELRRTWYGDANLDQQFDSSDFVIIFAQGQYEDQIELNSGWEDGDWNGDGDFTSSDLVLALADGGYQKGPRENLAVVPEPTTGWLLLIGLVSSLTMRRWQATR